MNKNNTKKPSARGVISHVEIYVSNLKRSKAFWEPLLFDLGYKLFQEWDLGVSYILDRTYIVLVATEERFLEPAYHRCRTGLNHLAFYVDSREEVDAFTEKLRGMGANILYEDRYPHAAGPDSYALFFEDPDRIKVEIVLYDPPEGKL